MNSEVAVFHPPPRCSPQSTGCLAGSFNEGTSMFCTALNRSSWDDKRLAASGGAVDA